MRRRLLQAATASVLLLGTLAADTPRAAALPLPDPPTSWPPVVYQQTWPEPDWTWIGQDRAIAIQRAWDAIDAERAETARRDAAIAESERQARYAAVSAAAWHRLPDWLLPLVVDAADAWGANPVKLARIVVCESGGNPNARNASGASGLGQHLARYWPARATAAGLSGASVFDPWANLSVSAMMLAQSDSPWNESRSCWR